MAQTMYSIIHLFIHITNIDREPRGTWDTAVNKNSVPSAYLT